MATYVTYEQIANAVDGMPIELTQDELIRVSRQTLSKLKYIRLAGRQSPALWRSDDLCAWFARRYKHAPELIQEFNLRLSLPDTANKKTKARAK